jgi:rubredoxin
MNLVLKDWGRTRADYRLDFFISKPLEKYMREIRRYADGKCPCPPGMGYHDATVFIDYVSSDGGFKEFEGSKGFCSKDDPRWSQKCTACGYVFKPTDHWQWRTTQMLQNPETGEEFPYDCSTPVRSVNHLRSFEFGRALTDREFQYFKTVTWQDHFVGTYQEGNQVVGAFCAPDQIWHLQKLIPDLQAIRNDRLT